EEYYCRWDECKWTEKFSTRSNLVLHIRYAHQGGLQCDYPGCEEVCLNRKEFTEHMAWHTSSKSEPLRYPCPVEGGDLVFTTRAAIGQHFEAEGKLNEAHAALHHDTVERSMVRRQRSAVPTEPKKCPAPSCNRVFATAMGLRVHLGMLYKCAEHPEVHA